MKQYINHFYNTFYKEMSAVVFFKGFAYVESMNKKIFATEKTLGKLMGVSTIQSREKHQHAVMIVESSKVNELLDFFGYTPYSNESYTIFAELSDIKNTVDIWRKKGEDVPKSYLDMIRSVLADLKEYDKQAVE